MDQLAHGSFASAFVRISSVRDVAVKIFRDHDLRRERAPDLRHLDVFLLENDLAAVVGDFRRALFPFDLVERRDLRVAENALEPQPATLCFRARDFCGRRASLRRFAREEGWMPGLSWIMATRRQVEVNESESEQR